MDFQLSEDQRALRAGIRDLLAGRFGRDRMRAAHDGGAGGVDRGLWRELGGAGFFALRLPETAGGVGLGLAESVLLFEEIGRALLPGPLAATQLAAGAVKGAAEGEAVVALAEPGRPVAHLAGADALLVLDGERTRLVTGAGLRRVVDGARPVRSLDPGTPLWRVPELSGTAGEVLEGGERLRHEGTLLTAAEQLGNAERSLEEAVRHARDREQFGAPIGSFQAVKHLCAGQLLRSGPARTAVYAAAVTGDPVEAAGAKLLADEAAVGNARDCLQVHGGMGFTWESDVHLRLKRAWLRSGEWLAAAEAEELLAADLA
ncbi:acyl-CoA dehydrogenase family protein [Streptomyces sp. NPDC057682]|uniref:acyl-CoA dehydrogenase family protein n=1 Tax=Streptomyces sp. NPDC057682 TaxID=3346210 RepID=UPI0036856269